MQKKMVFTLMVIALTCWSSCVHSLDTIMSEDQLHARGPIQHDDFVLNSIPKCGTHLIMSCIYHLINKYVDEACDYGAIEAKIRKHQDLTDYLRLLQTLKGQNFIHKTHIPYYPQVEDVLLEAGMKWIFCMRDPRDAIVSLVFYMEGLKHNGNHRDFMLLDSQIYDRLTLSNKINSAMTGTYCTNYLEKFLRAMYGWTKSPYGLVVRYEDLIGPAGGGSTEAQIKTIREIASYLNVIVSEDELKAVAAHTNRFKKPSVQHVLGEHYVQGQIGNWRMYFDESNKALFKQLFGNELIELGYERNSRW